MKGLGTQYTMLCPSKDERKGTRGNLVKYMCPLFQHQVPNCLLSGGRYQPTQLVVYLQLWSCLCVILCPVLVPSACTYTYIYSLCMQHWICSTVGLIAHSVPNDLVWLSWWVSGFKSYTTSSLISHILQCTWRTSRRTQCVNVQPQPPRTPILKSVAL